MEVQQRETDCRHLPPQEDGIGLEDQSGNGSFAGRVEKKGILRERTACAKAWKREGRY